MKHHDLILVLCNEGCLALKGDGTTFHPRDPRLPPRNSRLTVKALAAMKQNNSEYCLVDTESGRLRMATRQFLETVSGRLLPGVHGEKNDLFPDTFYALSGKSPENMLSAARKAPFLKEEALPLFQALFTLSSCMREARENYWREVVSHGQGPSFPSLKHFIWKNFRNDPRFARCRLGANPDQAFSVLETNWKNIVNQSLYGGRIKQSGTLSHLEDMVLSSREARNIGGRLKELYRAIPDEIRFFIALNPSDLAGMPMEPELLKSMNPLVLKEIYSEFALPNSPDNDLASLVQKHEKRAIKKLSFEQTCSLMADTSIQPDDKAWAAAQMQ